MKCPRHDKTLEPRRAGAHVAYACPTCSGLWLPTTVIRKLLGRPLTLDVETTKRATLSELYCPDDSVGLEQVVVHGVTIDWCPRCCALWFDHGELNRLLIRRSHKPSLRPILGTDYSAGKAVADGLGGLALDVILGAVVSLFDGF